MEGKRQHPTVPLKLQIQRGRLPEGRQQGVAGERRRRPIDEPLREIERLLTRIDVHTQHEVGLYVRDVPQDEVHMVRNLADLFHPCLAAGLRLCAQAVPRLNAWQHDPEPRSAEALEVGFAEERQGTLRAKREGTGLDGLLDGGHVVVEPDAEIRIVPANPSGGRLLDQELQVLTNLIAVERLVGNRRVDAELARVRTTETRDHRHPLDVGGCLVNGGLDELPPLPDAGDVRRLALGS